MLMLVLTLCNLCGGVFLPSTNAHTALAPMGVISFCNLYCMVIGNCNHWVLYTPNQLQPATLV